MRIENSPCVFTAFRDLSGMPAKIVVGPVRGPAGWVKTFCPVDDVTRSPVGRNGQSWWRQRDAQESVAPPLPVSVYPIRERWDVTDEDPPGKETFFLLFPPLAETLLQGSGPNGLQREPPGQAGTSGRGCAFRLTKDLLLDRFP